MVFPEPFFFFIGASQHWGKCSSIVWGRQKLRKIFEKEPPRKEKKKHHQSFDFFDDPQDHVGNEVWEDTSQPRYGCFQK